jgi:hypothetical protein
MIVSVPKLCVIFQPLNEANMRTFQAHPWIRYEANNCVRSIDAGFALFNRHHVRQTQILDTLHVIKSI